MPEVITLGLPGVQDVRLDVRVVLFTFALSALTAIVFGLLPLFVSERRDLRICCAKAERATSAAHVNIACRPCSSSRAWRWRSCCLPALAC